MIHFNYTLAPLAPVSAGRTGQVQQNRTIHRVLPGTTIRGALGHTWWLSPDHRFAPASSDKARQSAFDRLFGRSMVVTDAVPVATADNSARSLPVFRTRSMVRVKYSDDASRLHDLAGGPIPGCPACGRDFTPPRDRREALEPCVCGATFDSVSPGWWVPSEWEVAATRTALRDGVAESGKLFTRASLTPKVTYVGTVTLRDSAKLQPEVVDWLRQRMEFGVGGQLSTHGRVIWSMVDSDAPLIPQDETAVLQLRAPTLLVNDRGFPTFDLAGALSRIPGAGHTESSWLRTGQVSGWHSVARVPKPMEWALEAGTTAVLKGWQPEALARVARGLGLRQLEGYGHVALRRPGDLATFDRAADEPQLKAMDSNLVAKGTVAPTLADAADPETPPATSAPVTPSTSPLVQALVDLLGDRRARLLRAVSSAARTVQAERENGSEAGAAMQRELTKPWVMGLRPDERKIVRDILISDNLGALVVQLEVERDRA